MRAIILSLKTRVLQDVSYIYLQNNNWRLSEVIQPKESILDSKSDLQCISLLRRNSPISSYISDSKKQFVDSTSLSKFEDLARETRWQGLNWNLGKTFWETFQWECSIERRSREACPWRRIDEYLSVEQNMAIEIRQWCTCRSFFGVPEEIKLSTRPRSTSTCNRVI